MYFPSTGHFFFVVLFCFASTSVIWLHPTHWCFWSEVTSRVFALFPLFVQSIRFSSFSVMTQLFSSPSCVSHFILVSRFYLYPHISTSVSLSSLKVGGAAVLGVGVWTILEKSDYLSLLASSTFAVSTYILVLAGGLVVITGFLGCCAVIREQKRCLSTVRRRRDPSLCASWCYRNFPLSFRTFLISCHYIFTCEPSLNRGQQRRAAVLQRSYLIEVCRRFSLRTFSRLAL